MRKLKLTELEKYKKQIENMTGDELALEFKRLPLVPMDNKKKINKKSMGLKPHAFSFNKNLISSDISFIV